MVIFYWNYFLKCFLGHYIGIIDTVHNVYYEAVSVLSLGVIDTLVGPL